MSIDLKELAARLGLSNSTVSRALNGYADVSAATRERVERAARELGYQPNLAARRLARGQAEAVGIVYPLDVGDMGDPRFLEVVKGVSDRLDTEGMDLLLASARDHSELRTYERLTRGGRVDGVIVARTCVQDERIEYLQRTRVPFVAYGRTRDCSGYAWFDFDNEAGGALALRELVALGHRRIAYVHASLALNFAWQRHQGFHKALRDAGLAADAALVIEAGLSRERGHAAAAQLLALDAPPTAIVTDNNLCGIGLVRALLDRDLVLGRDVSVIVYDGVPADMMHVGRRIASIEQPTAYDAGRTMAEMLLGLMREEAATPPQMLRQPVYHPGDSVGPAP